VRERTLGLLANVSGDLAAQVATGLGLPAPAASPSTTDESSPALTQLVTAPGPVAGRVVGIVAVDGSDVAGVGKLKAGLEGQGVVVHVVGPHGGALTARKATVPVTRTLLTTRSVEFDAVVVAGGTGGFSDVKLDVLLQEMFRHAKPIAAWGDGADVLEAAGIDVEAPGIIVSSTPTAAQRKELLAALGLHRVWDRVPWVVAP